MTVPMYDLDHETLDHLRDGQGRNFECVRVLASLPDLIASLGEQPIKGVLLIVVPEEGDFRGGIAGQFCGDYEYIEITKCNGPTCAEEDFDYA